MSFLLPFPVIYFQNSIINGVRESHEKSVTDVEEGNVRKKNYQMINYGPSKLIYLTAIFPHQLTNNI